MPQLLVRFNVGARRDDMIHVQPHPMSSDNTMGMGRSFLTEDSPRLALLKWCREKGGWFRLEQISDYFHGSALWQAVWPGTSRRLRFVVTRDASPYQLSRR